MFSTARLRLTRMCPGLLPGALGPVFLGSASISRQEQRRVETHIYCKWKWRMLKNGIENCHGPAHWKEKLVLGSPPHHWLRNLSTSWHAGLWDVCRMKEPLALAKGQCCHPLPKGTPGA